MGKMIMKNREGEEYLELADGEWHLNADITIQDGKIRYIDNGIWTKGYKGEKYNSERKENHG